MLWIYDSKHVSSLLRIILEVESFDWFHSSSVFVLEMTNVGELEQKGDNEKRMSFIISVNLIA